MEDVQTTRSQVRVTDVKGSDVYGPDGDHLGHIDDVVLNKVDGKATTAIMSFGGFLGIGERYHPLPWETLHYDEGKGGFVVNVTRQQLEGGPTFGRDDEPDWNDPDYDRRILGHYGLLGAY